MIVAIDGPQHSGKTTCLNALGSHPSLHRDTRFIAEAARRIAPSFGVTNTTDWEDLLTDRMRLAAFFQAEYDLLHSEEVSPAVVDGSSLLVTAYARVFLDASALPKYTPTYDLIFVCAPWGATQTDGFRFLHHQKDVEREYRKLLGELGLLGKTVELPASEDRLELLRAHPVWADFNASSDS